MVRLIIAEKPSVARDIAKVLKVKTKREGHFQGNRVWISWCLGHMAQLCEPARYDARWKRWAAETLPMMPESFKLEPIGRTASHWRVLKKLMRHGEVEEVINACDAGREGELIFRYAYELAGCAQPVRRLWLSSMTDQAISTAFSNLRPGSEFDALGDAARCRSEADWLVGLNATRALTIRGRQAGHKELLSVGRVQTPTLAMIVHREEEIESFVPESFWQVYAHFEVKEGLYEGIWTQRKGDNRLDKEEEAQAVASAVESKTGTVKKLQQKKVRERPGLLHDLTQLQRVANKRHGITAAATLAAAQSLYEKHKIITYPRTDSNHLTTDLVPTLPARVKALSIGPWKPFADTLLAALPLKVSRRIVNNKEVGDHHAIIPTGVRPKPERLSATEAKIFDLVARRFIAVFYPDAVFATTRIETVVADHLFLTRGRVRLDPGWQLVDPPAKTKRKKTGAGQDVELPKVTEGESARVDRVRVHQGVTKPPRRYNEAALLGAMERAGQELEEAQLRRAMKESGLGTPATRASIIETLLRREYIQRQGKNLVPRPKGRTLIHAVPSADLKSAQLTGQWEARLSKVAQGQLTRARFMDEVRALNAQLIPDLLASNPTPPSRGDGQGPQAQSLGRCPVCNTCVEEGHKAYSCQRGRDCTFVIFKRVAARKISPDLARVLLSKGRSRTLKGFRSKAGKSFSAALKLGPEGKVELCFEKAKEASTAHKGPAGAAAPPSAQTKAAGSPLGPNCPACDEGKVIRGHRAWGCSGWRQGCRFAILFESHGHRIPEDEALRLFTKGRTRMMDGFVTSEGSRVRGRLALDVAAQGNVRLELSKAKKRRRKKQG